MQNDKASAKPIFDVESKRHKFQPHKKHKDTDDTLEKERQAKL